MAYSEGNYPLEKEDTMYINNKVMTGLCITLAVSLNKNVSQARTIAANRKNFLKSHKMMSDALMYLAHKQDKAGVPFDEFDRIVLQNISGK